MRAFQCFCYGLETDTHVSITTKVCVGEEMVCTLWLWLVSLSCSFWCVSDLPWTGRIKCCFKFGFGVRLKYKLYMADHGMLKQKLTPQELSSQYEETEAQRGCFILYGVSHLVGGRTQRKAHIFIPFSFT